MNTRLLPPSPRPARRIKSVAAHLLRMVLVAFALANGLPALRAQTTFQLPLSRVGHNFSLRQWNPGTNSYQSSALFEYQITYAYTYEDGTMDLSTNSYLQASGSVNLPGDFVLVDDTNGETGPPNIFGTPSYDRTSFLTTPWFTNGEASTSFFFTLPEARADHVLTLFAQGVSYSVSNGPVLRYSAGNYSDLSYGFFEGWTSTGPGGPYFLVDHTAHEQSDIRAAANRDFLSNTTWSVLSGLLPTRLLTLWLPESQAGHRFALHTSAGSLEWLDPSVMFGTDSNGVFHSGLQVSATIGVNQNFSLVRELAGVDTGGAMSSGFMGIEDLSLDWTGMFTPYEEPPPPPPYEPDWQTMTVQVGENHWGETETIVFRGIDRFGQETLVYPVADWANQGFQAAFDYEGNEYYRYSYVPYTAVVDANCGYWAQDSSGHTSLMDGFNPPYLPTDQNVSIQVGENHWNDTIQLHLSDGSVVAAQPNASTQGWLTAVDSQGHEYYSYSYVSYGATIPLNLTYTVDDSAGHTEFMDGFNPPYLPNYQTVAIRVGENHWNDGIQIHLEDGSIVSPQPDPNTEGARIAMDPTGTEYYRYRSVDYVATIDVNRPYSLDDGAGHTAFMDGFRPPALPTASFPVGENHWSHTILFHLSSGRTVPGTPDWSTQGFQAATDSQEVPYYFYNWVNYVVTLGVNESVLNVGDALGHAELMDGFLPPPPPEDFPPLNLQIAASRWQHTLEVRTSSGYSFPVTADRMQGFWTVDRTSQSWWTSYYFLNATSQSHIGQNWWVSDVTMGDTAPPNTNDLSNWASPDANADSDYDGLVNWYEALVGTDPNSSDGDHDGMPDVWEVAHHLNGMGDDSADDPDGDGWTNLEEYRMGTDPRRSTVKVTIISPAGAIFLPAKN